MRRCRRQPTTPNRWTGEADCVLGPFARREVADRFLDLGAVSGASSAYVPLLFEHEGAWYVDLHPDRGGARASRGGLR